MTVFVCSVLRKASSNENFFFTLIFFLQISLQTIFFFKLLLFLPTILQTNFFFQLTFFLSTIFFVKLTKHDSFSLRFQTLQGVQCFLPLLLQFAKLLFLSTTLSNLVQSCTNLVQCCTKLFTTKLFTK